MLFPVVPIFNDLQSPKMPVHPSTGLVPILVRAGTKYI